jgi:PAS domain S-box-containing protein
MSKQPAPWWQSHDFFSNYGNYMPRIHCLRAANGGPDWPWIIAIVVPTLAVIIGYIRIFHFWRRAYLAEAVGDRNKKLMDLANIFLWCAFCGYVLSLLMFVWPAYRLGAVATVILAIWTWRFAFNLDAFKVSLSARRLERELAAALRERNTELEGLVEIRTRAMRHAQTEVERQKRLIEAVLDAADYSIISANVAGTIQTVNRTACKWLGYRPDELLGNTPAAFHDPAEMTAAAQTLTKAFGRHIEPGFDVFSTPAASGQADEREWTYIRKDATRFPVSLSLTAMRDGNDLIVGYLSIATDLTVSKALAELTERHATEERQHAREMHESEGRLRAILENAVDGIITIDERGNIASFNPAAARLFGYTAEQAIGKNIKMLMPPPHHDEHDGYLLNYAATGIKKIIGTFLEVVGRRWDGSLFPVELSVSEAKPGENRLFTGIVRDISERKAAEAQAALQLQAVHQSEGRLRAVLENAVDGIITIDERGNIESFNPAAVRLFGYAPEGVIGKNIKMLMPAPYQDEHDGYLRNYAATGIKKIIGIGREVVGRRNDGSQFPMDLSVGETSIGANRLFTGIVRDISERKRAQAALKDQASLLDLAHDCIFVCDLNSKILYWNQGAATHYGWSAREALGNVTHAFLKTVFPAPLEEINAQLFQTGHWEGELVHTIRDGSLITVASRWALRKDAQGNPSTILQINSDITRHKQAELAAIHLATLVESSNDAIIGKDLDGTITSWNRGAEAMFGYTAAEIVGTSIRRLVPADRQGEEDRILQEVALGNHWEQLETVRQTKDGSSIHASLTVSPIKDKTGKVVGAAKIVRDISERKRSEEEIRQLNGGLERRIVERTAALQATNSELEAFCYSVSHDLRTPLRGLSGFSQILMDEYSDKLDEQGMHYLKRICVGSQRMGELIDDLLNLSRVSRGELTRELTDLSKMANEVVAELRGAEPVREVDIVVADGMAARTDPRLLRVVLTNLFANAWKFTTKQPHPRIEFGSSQKNGGTEYFLTDNGAGFDQGHTAKLFQAFQRLHAQADFPGTGIGLATIQRIIQRQGGAVRAEGKVNQGATFYFTL